MTISLCMIVKNEEAVLERCLRSVEGVVDEIIILDTGSTDRTKEIARRFTRDVYDFTWADDFSAARNAAFSYARMEYQMWLDADDVLPPDQRDLLMELKKTLPPDTDMVTMRYNTHFDADGNPVLTSVRERLTRTERGYLWQDPVHECIPLQGKLFHSGIAIDHRKPEGSGDSGRNLRIYENWERSGRAFTPRQTYYYARELRDHGRYEEAARHFEVFLDGGEGWGEDNIGACHLLGLCYRALGDTGRALKAFLRSFEMGGPRAEACVEIGYHFMALGRYADAAGWFQAAARIEKPETEGFYQRDYWGYIPHLELCVCYYRLGDAERARRHNALAGECKPGSATVRDNEAFFASMVK